MALIEVKTDGTVPATEIQALQSAVYAGALSIVAHFAGVTPQVSTARRTGGAWPVIIEADVAGQLPDQALADLANTCFELTRASLRHIGRWRVDFNSPAHVRKLANRIWDTDGQAHRWPSS